MIEKKLDVIKRILLSKNLSSTHGQDVELFEYRLAKYVGSSNAIAVNSGTAALHTALLALGVGQGDEVIVPAWTFISTVSAVLMCGATPVFADIRKDSFNIDPDSIIDKLNHKTKAVIVVHLAGIPFELWEVGWILHDSGVALIEDACQALGAEYNECKVGTIGDIGVYSFYPSKIITTGEGGMIVTDNEELARECRLIRDHGQTKKYYAKRLGFNYRMTNIQGALGSIELEDIDKRIEEKTKSYKEITGRYLDMFKFPKIPEYSKIAPTYIPAWYNTEIPLDDKKFYIPLYKLPLFKQDIELQWTEYAYKYGVKLFI